MTEFETFGVCISGLVLVCGTIAGCCIICYNKCNPTENEDEDHFLSASRTSETFL